ncbi:MAG: YigZ family protein, partial [Halobacteriaceae archaeon]
MDAYRTLGGRGRAAFEVRGSEFVGHAAPARTVEDAEAFVASVREAFADATHNVPAYRVRQGESEGLLREDASDDGEPTGSAGDPALNVLVQRDIENAVVVVTRYYGGTNLGVGGLARAYGRATKEA